MNHSNSYSMRLCLKKYSFWTVCH